MALLLALCGPKHDLSVREVPLTAAAQGDVVQAFGEQEAAFRRGPETPFDENWLNEGREVVTAPVPPGVDAFAKIDSITDTAVPPIDTGRLDEVRGLAMKPDTGPGPRVLVQVFAPTQSLTRHPFVALFLEAGTYTRLEPSSFRLDDKLVCIVEHGLVKFRSLHNLGRVIDTSAIFRAATDDDVVDFASTYSTLFDIPDVDRFVDGTSRNARRYLASLSRSGVLDSHTAQTLQSASAQTNLSLVVEDGRIVMPRKGSEITELMRFLNDGRYVGPISGKPFITNSRRPAT